MGGGGWGEFFCQNKGNFFELWGCVGGGVCLCVCGGEGVGGGVQVGVWGGGVRGRQESIKNARFNMENLCFPMEIL